MGALIFPNFPNYPEMGTRAVPELPAPPIRGRGDGNRMPGYAISNSITGARFALMQKEELTWA